MVDALHTMDLQDWDEVHHFTPDRRRRVEARAAQVLGEAFVRHWAWILRDLDRGVDVASRTKRFFLVPAGERLRLARVHYSRERAERFASMTVEEALDRMRPWAGLAISHALQQDWDDLRVAHQAIRRVARGEYVFHVDGFDCRSNRSKAGYDDVYERTVGGVTTSGTVTVYKQTGERFGPRQRRAAFWALVDDFVEGHADAGDEDQWTLQLENAGAFAVQIRIMDSEFHGGAPEGWSREDEWLEDWPTAYV